MSGPSTAAVREITCPITLLDTSTDIYGLLPRLVGNKLEREDFGSKGTVFLFHD